VAAPETASPSGSYVRSLTFYATGSFSSGFHVYGIYPGEPSEEVSAYQRTEGTYRAEGSRIVFQATRLVWWDRYYGVGSQERTVEPYPYEPIFDDARYEIHGRQLKLYIPSTRRMLPKPRIGVHLGSLSRAAIARSRRRK
jgi:hypothetical protein